LDYDAGSRSEAAGWRHANFAKYADGGAILVTLWALFIGALVAQSFSLAVRIGAARDGCARSGFPSTLHQRLRTLTYTRNLL
jgi:hypothetical protein